MNDVPGTLWDRVEKAAHIEEEGKVIDLISLERILKEWFNNEEEAMIY